MRLAKDMAKLSCVFSLICLIDSKSIAPAIATVVFGLLTVFIYVAEGK